MFHHLGSATSIRMNDGYAAGAQSLQDTQAAVGVLNIHVIGEGEALQADGTRLQELPAKPSFGLVGWPSIVNREHAMAVRSEISNSDTICAKVTGQQDHASA